MFDFVIGADHAGFNLKERIVKILKEKHSVKDFGTDSVDSVDYPDIGVEVACFISKGKAKRGILICGTGIGMCIVANKVKGVRAALCHNEFTARMSREHNDSNILVMGSRVIGRDLALATLEAWIETSFGGCRHQRRLDKINTIEKENIDA